MPATRSASRITGGHPSGESHDFVGELQGPIEFVRTENHRGTGGGGFAEQLVDKIAPLLVEAGMPTLVVAGLLVGIGTRYGGGCTSGHGVGGICRMSPRSIVATLVFMAVGFVTVYVVRHLVGA